jgi:hypothetical protein
LSVAREIVYLLHTRGEARLEGQDWERIFAEAIRGQWRPSNVGLDDVQLGNCCWGAKTVKNNRPSKAHKVRLICGRNSLDYSYRESDSRGMAPSDVGGLVLGIWNARFMHVQDRFPHVRTAVLLKSKDLSECALFEFETQEYELSDYIWSWNKRGNLEGHDSEGQHRFTWQPHGAQFTIIEDVPKNRLAFRVRTPHTLSKDQVMQQLGFDESWIEYI